MYGMPTRVRNLYLGMLRTEARRRDEELSWLVHGSRPRNGDLRVRAGQPPREGQGEAQGDRVHGQLPGSRAAREEHPRRPADDELDQRRRLRRLVRRLRRGQARARTARRRRAVRRLPGATCFPESFGTTSRRRAFRTDFRPEDGDLDEVGVMSTRTVATVAREGKPQDVGSIRIHAGAGTTIMQLNDGRPDDLGEQQLFEVEIMTDQDVAAFPRGVQLARAGDRHRGLHQGQKPTLSEDRRRHRHSSACSRERRPKPYSWRPSVSTSG